MLREFGLIAAVSAMALPLPASASQPTMNVSLPSNTKVQRALVQGNSKAAVAILYKAVAQKPNDLQTRRCLVEALLKSGAAGRAAREMQQLVGAGLRSPQDFCLLGDAYRYSGHYSSALLNYQEALNVDPSLAGAWSGIAYTYYANGNNTLALKACRQGLARLADPASKATLLKAMETVQQTIPSGTQISSLSLNQQ